MGSVTFTGWVVHPMPGLSFLTDADRTLARAISRLAYCNPFLPERIECERQALSGAFVPGGTLWHASGDPEPPPNVPALRNLAEALSERLAVPVGGGRAPQRRGSAA